MDSLNNENGNLISSIIEEKTPFKHDLSQIVVYIWLTFLLSVLTFLSFNGYDLHFFYF